MVGQDPKSLRVSHNEEPVQAVYDSGSMSVFETGRGSESDGNGSQDNNSMDKLLLRNSMDRKISSDKLESSF